MKEKQNSSVYSSFIDLFKFSKKNNKDNVEDLKENKRKDNTIITLIPFDEGNN